MSQSGYQGEFHRRLDSKQRVAIPTPFRARGEGRFYVVYGVDTCLSVYDEKGYELRLNLMRRLSENRQVARSMLHVVYTGVYQECDSTGRIMLMSELTKLAAIRKDVAIIGMDSHFEIWSKELWERQRLEDIKKFKDNCERLDDMLRALHMEAPQSPPAAPPAQGPTHETNAGS